MLHLPRFLQDEEDRLKHDREASQSAMPRAQLALDGRLTPAPRPAPAPALAPWPPTIPSDASPEKRELIDLLEAEDAVIRRRARIAELQPQVEAQDRAPQLAAIKELFAQRADAVALAEGRVANLPPERQLEARLRQYDVAARLEDILSALAINHDCSALLESLPALVTQAVGENVARLRGDLFRTNVSLGQRRYGLEGRRNPTMRAPAVERPWKYLLTAARG
jgi:hypothetical protein